MSKQRPKAGKKTQMVDQLTDVQADLRNSLLDAGPDRWCLKLTPGTSLRPKLLPVLCNIMTLRRNQSKGEGMLLAPTPMWHSWRAAGWTKDPMSPIALAKHTAAGVDMKAANLGTLVVDELHLDSYHHKFLTAFDLLLEANPTVFSCLVLPATAGLPPDGLGALLAKHRYILLDLK